LKEAPVEYGPPALVAHIPLPDDEGEGVGGQDLAVRQAGHQLTFGHAGQAVHQLLDGQADDGGVEEGGALPRHTKLLRERRQCVQNNTADLVSFLSTGESGSWALKRE